MRRMRRERVENPRRPPFFLKCGQDALLVRRLPPKSFDDHSVNRKSAASGVPRRDRRIQGGSHEKTKIILPDPKPAKLSNFNGEFPWVGTQLFRVHAGLYQQSERPSKLSR